MANYELLNGLASGLETVCNLNPSQKATLNVKTGGTCSQLQSIKLGLMLLWFEYLTNVTEKLQFIDPTFRHSCLVPSSSIHQE